MRHRQFWYILLATAIAWLLFTMSERDDYPLPVVIEWTGYDTARYVVTYADTVLPLTVQINGFQAIRLQKNIRDQHFEIKTGGDTAIAVNSDLFARIAEQYSIPNGRHISSNVATVRLTLQERAAKAFVPQLRGVEFMFDDQYGLSGTPRIEPDTVWLYGAPSSLEKVGELYTSPTVVRHVSDSSYYTLSLEPVWREHPDLRPSTDVVRIFVPAERFVLTTVSVPVDVQGVLGNQQMRLYPERVEVAVWAPESSYREVNATQFEALVQYDPADPSRQLPVTITRFPAQVRIRDISPAAVQYVLIQK